jgi:ADP-heptose:LPS heptosyltransferase
VEVLSKWEKEIPNTTSLAGKLSLSDELNMISKLRVMISMDSANMHLASLVGTRVVSVWGATHPYAGF